MNKMFEEGSLLLDKETGVNDPVGILYFNEESYTRAINAYLYFDKIKGDKFSPICFFYGAKISEIEQNLKISSFIHDVVDQFSFEVKYVKIEDQVYTIFRNIPSLKNMLLPVGGL